jgi:hypothetical protein
MEIKHVCQSCPRSWGARALELSGSEGLPSRYASAVPELRELAGMPLSQERAQDCPALPPEALRSRSLSGH